MPFIRHRRSVIFRAGTRSSNDPTFPRRTGRPATLAVAAMALLTVGTAWSASYPDHRGTSPWSFDAIAPPSDVYVVNDADGATIDRYMFRPDGDIVIDIPIRRYIGPTDGNGHLLDIEELVNRGIVSRTFSVTMPAFDVDAGVFPVFDCDGDDIPDQLHDEVNHVFFNEEKIGQLQGQNNIWFQNSFTLPIDKLRFPSEPGGIAVNRVRIEIDVANRDVVLSSGAVGCVVWATEIDWVGIRFEASSPVALVHGIRSSGETWEDFKDGLAANHVLADNSITLRDPVRPQELPLDCRSHPYNDTMAFNIRQLREKIPEIASRYGSGALHMIGHSKGGLDSRGFLSGLLTNPIPIEVGRMSGQPVTVDLEVRSLATLNTPHKGSVLAQYGVEARKLTFLQTRSDPLLLGGLKYQFEGPYYCDLTPARANAFVAATLLPSVTRAASAATDADADGDGVISGNESRGFVLDYIADRLYRVVGNTADVTIQVIPSGWPFIPDTVQVNEVPTAQFMPNDLIVTTDSAAQYPIYPIDGFNHLNVHGSGAAHTIADDAQANELLHWRLR